jgi:hypothetical protein
MQFPSPGDLGTVLQVEGSNAAGGAGHRHHEEGMSKAIASTLAVAIVGLALQAKGQTQVDYVPAYSYYCKLLSGERHCWLGGRQSSDAVREREREMQPKAAGGPK